jgi:hypothetical protein
MPSRPSTFRPHGQRSKAERDKEADVRRGSARERGYSRAWDKAAKGHLRHHPLCVYCALQDVVAAAELVDHLYPHRVYPDIFWRTEWWCSSCTTCHSGFKQGLERQGKAALDRLAHRLGLPVMAGG